MNTEQIKQFILGGQWISIAPEIRPSSTKNPDGTLKPFYLTRQFKYLPDDKFELQVINFADPIGKVPLAKMFISGQMVWEGEHPIAAGAQKVNFIADAEYQLTPLHQGFADVMNQFASQGFHKWELGDTQSILKKAFAPFGLSAGQFFEEFDLIYIFQDMMFWGARNVDGRGFDKEANRPTNLQIPLVRDK
jgi:hypothetical protein